MRKSSVGRGILCGAVIWTTGMAFAETLALYTFNDGAAGAAVSSVVSTQGTWSGGGIAHTLFNGNAPVFSDEVPGKHIYAGVQLTNCVIENPQSVQFSANNVDSASKDGGKIVFAALASDLTARNAFTLEFFFKPETTSTWHAAFWMPVNSAQSHRFKFSAPAGGADAMSLQNQGESGSVNKSIVGLLNTWHHFALVYEKGVNSGDDKVTGYIDHAEVGSFTSTAETVTANLPVTLGCSNDDSEAFIGKLACFRVSDGALAADDMLYAVNNVNSEKETFGFWPFRDGTAGETVGAVTNAVAWNPLDGNAAHYGVAAAPVFSEEAPGRLVWSDAGMTNLLVRRPQSVSFYTANATSMNAAAITFKNLVTQLSFCDDFTLELFAKVETNATWRTLYHFWMGESTETIWKTCAPASNANLVEFERQKPDGQLSRSVPDLDDGTWHHFASVYKGAEHKMHVYLDGTEIGSGLGCVNTPRTGQHFFLGCADPYSEGFCGKVSCLRVTARALDPAEFMACSQEPGLVIIVK